MRCSRPSGLKGGRPVRDSSMLLSVKDSSMLASRVSIASQDCNALLQDSLECSRVQEHRGFNRGAVLPLLLAQRAPRS